jgi:hypothetical protein
MAAPRSLTEKGEPLMSTRARPPAAISRRTMSSIALPCGSVSMPSSSSCVRSFFGSEMTASAVILSLPARIISVEPRAPRRNSSESISSDLPAPVSPVRTLSPGPGSMASSSTMARLRTLR